MDSTRPDAAEKVHQIHGTGLSFSTKPNDLDETAAEVLEEIARKRIQGLDVHLDTFVTNPEETNPEDLPKGFFLSIGTSFWKNYSSVYLGNDMWRSRDSIFGYAIGHHASAGYTSFKRTFVHHKDNHKTNWIMVVYSLIHENRFIKTKDVVLCHLFQSDNYNPRPNPFLKSEPNFFDFHKKEVDSRMLQLEGLMKNPESFKDFYEFDQEYSKWKANGRNGKRADVWKEFTDIKVLGPDGQVMLTLAICHGCSMAYLTGKWDSKKGCLSNNGTKTLKEHHRKCSAQHHIAGNPQGAHHQMP